MHLRVSQPPCTYGLLPRLPTVKRMRCTYMCLSLLPPTSRIPADWGTRCTGRRWMQYANLTQVDRLTTLPLPLYLIACLCFLYSSIFVMGTPSCKSCHSSCSTFCFSLYAHNFLDLRQQPARTCFSYHFSTMSFLAKIAKLCDELNPYFNFSPDLIIEHRLSLSLVQCEGFYSLIYYLISIQ